MRSTTIGDVKVLLPDLEPDDLDNTTDLADGLTEALVEGAGWHGARLENARIRSSLMTGVDLSDSVWEAGSLYGCEITRTDFSGARLTGITIERCAITGSRFTGTRLTDVRLKDVLFDDCRFDYATFHRVTAAGSVAFTDCTLAHATWSTCRLPGIALRSCNLDGMEIDSCHLDGADLRGSRLHGLKTALDNLRGVTVSQDQLPDFTKLTIDALDLAVRDD
ncbi:pentapeptide repeat-containing protein [Micromonospora sp. ATCC 39149]|uniref:Pentapeptide repeat-containing protein n=1 Tax=Micromonospora carbonacea TaxID=47853 RepID=A0A7D6C843_9ACTN|nr:pentapeptide repeat-containing protein [Micromonospora sp. ATCC 39149]EEP73562.1 pentapeptide repeat-containing protein [Micromonospora sp. ATCC 39149]QLJ99487.1 pentapeptide repeat-containing protein [Micromonospora carbonacea]